MRTPSQLPRHAGLIAGIATAVSLLAPVAANAAYTSVVGGSGPVLTGDGASDVLTISESGGLLTHNRRAAGDLDFNSQFDFDSATAGDQTVAAATNVTINAGAGDDLVSLFATALTGSTVHLNEGEDTAFGTPAVDNFFGDEGEDRLVANRGNDIVAGGDGNDVMVWNNGDGSDKMDGEGNSDEVEVNGAPSTADQFTVKPNGDRVRLDRVNVGLFNIDIGSTERLTVNSASGADTITAEAGLAPLILLTLNGGPGADTITGGDGPDLISGGDGTDTLSGAGADDRIVGDRGNDTINGDDGDDVLVWNNGDNDDTIDGAAGVDRTEVNGAPRDGDAFSVAANGARVKFDRTNLVPFSLDIGTSEALQVSSLGGDDTLTTAPATPIGVSVDGGSGNDNLQVRDGTSSFVRCGDGTDSAVADEVLVDLVLADCESVDRPAPTPPPTVDKVGEPPKIAGGNVKVTGKLRKARARVRLSCPATETGGCTGRLTLTSASKLQLGRARVVVVLGSATFKLAAGESKTVNVKLPSTLKAIAGKRRKLKARAGAVSRDTAGNRSESSAKLTLRLPKR
jgi:Ca2+-binding RTX toxin-like protein